jgi:hypothetical protein
LRFVHAGGRKSHTQLLDDHHNLPVNGFKMDCWI